MTDTPAPAPVSLTGRVQANAAVSSGLIRLDLELEAPCGFQPGQFAMLNLAARQAFVFSRPFSIFAAEGRTMSFLYRVVGQGTAAMAELGPGEAMVMLGPLGRPFPAPDPDRRAILIAGGVGLPPVHSWWARYGRPGDAAFFGGRDGTDVPWGLLDPGWGVSVDDHAGVPGDREAFHGLVTQLVESRIEPGSEPIELFACGPEPLLKAAGRMAATRGWRGWLSLEEHMGCGYGACKGCVIAVRDGSDDPAGWRTATCCLEGPVFPAEQIVWDAAAAPTDSGACGTGGDS